MIWLKIAGIYLALGTVVIALSPYKKYHLSNGADLSKVPIGKIVLLFSITFTAAVLVWPLVTKMIYTKPRTALDLIQELGMKHFQQGCGLPDKTVKRISQEVMGKFKKTAEERGERIPGKTLLAISSKFMNVYEKFGEEMYQSHLTYELEKYKNEGLRDEYK